MAEALKPPAEAEKVFYVARKFGSCYKEVIEAGLRCHRASVDEEFKPFVDIAARVGSALIEEMERFVAQFRVDIEQACAAADSGDSVRIQAKLHMRFPPMEPFMAEMARAREIIISRKTAAAQPYPKPT